MKVRARAIKRVMDDALLAAANRFKPDGRKTLCSHPTCNRPHINRRGLGKCDTHFRKYRRWLLKHVIVEAMGGVCSKCAGAFPLSAFDFHHTGEKKDAPSNLLYSASTARISEELAQCVLLCANCHRGEHANG